ncbi:putative histidine kinase [Streptococcus pyogenes]|uniref:sensor histidine kinase n=1 Tax=Streptococcus pyogenes TaxID=1314 RepID=UPI0010A159F8|nr:HAMP domain-containing sensor histidine kinase [Streptococcus pyogenes]UEN91542.1 HAMP domain-containing histidine kinase [Streptococcus pyogenes]VGW32640.1 putative histidine kinase [Streptococcus pyogenes]VGW36444.1 putative histidine kinase [Streptococcus pyogenes]VGW86518.1 putative histidine kinase [Streptococcus pyogenes]VGX16773.1 putative histidine kinase [Streptococcus pyogenes]
MNIFKKNILKFILSFFFIIIIDVILLITATNYIRSQQSASTIIETVSSEITLSSNGKYNVSSKAKQLIDDKKLWIMIIDKDSGKEKFNINKPQIIENQFDFADAIRFSRFYLKDYPVFTQIKDNDIYIIAFPKDSIIRYSSNYFELNRVQIFPILILSIIFANCLFCLFLYIYSVTFLNRNIKPIINAITKLPNGINTQVKSVRELDKLTLAINSANQQLRENEEFKENWISGIAHDIKTPLSVIVSNTSLAIEKTNDDEFLKHLKPTLVESHYIQNLLNDLNIFARLTNGNLKLNHEIVDIIPFFKEIIIQIINQEIWEDFNFEFIPDSKLLGKKMYIEKALISRVVHNLIYNSVLHNHSGCDIKIILEYLSEDCFSITIRDNGIGTSPERLKNINKIEEFNFDMSGVRRSGMGLKISKQIIDLHDGNMIITSTQGQYFQTVITLPIESLNT